MKFPNYGIINCSNSSNWRPVLPDQDSPGRRRSGSKTIKNINDKILEFRTQFAGKDMQDYIAMVLAWYATEQNTAVAVEVEKANLEDQLNTIEKMLDNQLKNSK